MKKNNNLVIETIKIFKIPLIYCSILVIGSKIILYKFNNKIFVSFYFVLVSIIYFFAIIYENKENSLINKVINFTIFTLLVSPLTVYAIVLLMKVISPSLEPIGNEASWVGFFGTLIGGSMVMFGIVFTMQHENLLNANKSIPQLSITPIEFNNIFGYSCKVLEHEGGNKSFKPRFKFILKNTSNAPIVNLKIENIIIGYNSRKINSYTILGGGFNTIGQIPMFPEKSQDVLIILDIDEEIELSDNLYLQFDMKYSDSFSINNYNTQSWNTYSVKEEISNENNKIVLIKPLNNASLFNLI